MSIIGVLTRLCVVGIGLGIAGMFQPWVFDLFRWSFLLLLICTIVYTVVGRFPAQASPARLPATTAEAAAPTAPTSPTPPSGGSP